MSTVNVYTNKDSIEQLWNYVIGLERRLDHLVGLVDIIRDKLQRIQLDRLQDITPYEVEDNHG